MKALILAAGLGKRLGLEDTPKPMYKVNNKPVLEHNILLLQKHNVTDICITLFYKGDVIKNYFGDGSKWGVKISYSYEKELLGTGGALLNVTSFFDKSSFFIVYGDNYTNTDLSKMFKFHEANKPIATIALFDPTKSLNSGIAGGRIKLDEDNNITSFVEGGGKEVAGYVNSGIYILEHEILDMIPKSPPSDFGKDVFPKLLREKKKIKGYLSDSFVLAIDTQDALSVTKEILKQEEETNDNN